MFEGQKVLWVAGGRDYVDSIEMGEKLADAAYGRGFEVLIAGAARGADSVAELLWRRMQLPYVGIPAQWDMLGKRAGYVRNRAIAEQGPDALLALPGGRGTQHARDIARELGIPILDAQ